MAPHDPDDDDGPPEDRPMTLAEHLDELRTRVLWAAVIVAVFCVVCAYYEDELLALALAPAADVLESVPGGGFIVTEIGEMFFTGMKLDVVAGVFFAAPLVLYLIWGFVARGLHAHEKRWVRIFAPVSYLLFLGGCVFFYFVIQPITLGFLLTYHTKITSLVGRFIHVEPKPRLAETVSFFLSMTLVTGLLFEMPLVMLFLQAIRICSWRTYLKFWKHFVVGLLVFSAVITPTGDAFTLAVFMAPVLVLFFGGILACRIVAPPDI